MKPLDTPISISLIAEALGGELRAQGDVQVDRIASLENATSGSISFITSGKYSKLLASTTASVVIMSSDYMDQYSGNAIITPDPYLYFARLTQWWKKYLQSLLPASTQKIHPTACVHSTAQIASTATIQAGAVIEAHACIGAYTNIGAQTYIGEGVVIGSHGRIAPHVTILNDCHIGDRVVINSGTVIGGDGFGFAPEGKHWVKIEQLGAVRIGDDVEIGVNTCIDRGALEDTVIGNGVKLDNLIQIAHNVHVGDDTVMASLVGISGSTRIGKNCVLAGAVHTAGHLEIVDNVLVLGATNVTKSITEAGSYSGTIPFDEANAWRKSAVLIKHLSAMRDRIRELEKQVSSLTTIQKD